MSEIIKVLDRKRKVVEGELPVVVSCITYKQNGKTYYLVNQGLLDDEILNDYYISNDDNLYKLMTISAYEISNHELDLLEKLRASARKPETSMEILLAMESDELIENKFNEMGFLDDEEAPGDDCLCE